MKILTFVLISFLLLIFLTSTCFSQSLTDSLVAVYCFDGNANDNYNTNHCTVNGATLTNDRFGANNKAYYFNGSNAFIELPHKNWIPNNFSITGWIKIDTLKYFERFFEFGNGVNAENVFYSFTTTSLLSSFTIHDCNNGFWYQRIQPNNNFPINIWTHLGITFNNINDSVHVYLNSTLWFMGKLSPQTCNTFKTMNFFGKSGFSSNPDSYFKGKMDDIRIYNRELNQNEIYIIFQNDYCSPIQDSITAHFNSSFPNLCDSLFVQFVDSSFASNANITSWNWNFGDIGSGANNLSSAQNPVHHFSSSGMYNVQLIATNNFSMSDTFVTTIQVVSNPIIANAGPTINLNCNTSFDTLGTAPIFGYTYSWAPAIGLNNINSAQPISTITSTTLYTVTVTGTNGCTATSTVSVNVDNSPPFANAGPTQNLDCNSTNTLIGSAIIPGYTYSWYPAIGLNNTAIAQPTASPLTSNNYTVTVSASNGCTATSNVQVNVNNTPPYASAGTNQTVNCMTTSALIGTPSIIGNSYSWSPSNGLSSTNSSQPIASPTMATTYSVTVTGSNGCTASSTVFVNYFGNPPLADAGPTQYLNCNLSNTQIGTPSILGNSYLWSPSTNLNSTTIAQPVANPSTSTIYTITVTGSNGCTSTSSVLVDVNVISPSAIAGPTQTINCTLLNIPLGTPAISGNSYSWSPSVGLNATIVAQPMANPISTTTYSVVVTGSNGCTNTSYVTVNVDNSPPIANAGPMQNLNCNSLSTNLGIAPVSGYSYSWTPTNSLNASTIAQPIASPTTSTIYTVVVTGSNTCTATSQVSINVDNSPPLIDAGNTVNLNCLFSSGSIGTNAIPGNAYNWQPTSGLNNSMLAQPVASPNTSTTYTLQVIGANGCIAYDSVTVNVKPISSIIISPDSLVCQGDSIHINVSGGNSYQWAPSNGLNVSLGANVVCSPSSTTTYTISYTDSIGCVGIALKTIEVLESPTISVSKSNDINCKTRFAALLVTGNYYYSWQPAIGLNNSHLANPIATPINSTIYTVTASNGQCDISDTISVYVNDAFEHDIFIPNSFSPNYDDLNDCFKIVTKSKFEKYSCKIFNRWGQEVFQSNDWNQCWEGNYLNSNKEAPLGTYFYLIEIETDCGRTIKKGDITLLR